MMLEAIKQRPWLAGGVVLLVVLAVIFLSGDSNTQAIVGPDPQAAAAAASVQAAQIMAGADMQRANQEFQVAELQIAATLEGAKLAQTIELSKIAVERKNVKTQANTINKANTLVARVREAEITAGKQVAIKNATLQLQTVKVQAELLGKSLVSSAQIAQAQFSQPVQFFTQPTTQFAQPQFAQPAQVTQANNPTQFGINTPFGGGFISF